MFQPSFFSFLLFLSTESYEKPISASKYLFCIGWAKTKDPQARQAAQRMLSLMEPESFKKEKS